MTADREIQILKDKRGKPAFVVVPWARWQSLTGGDAEDAYLAKRYKLARGRNDVDVPWEVAKRVVAGENAVKVYREWRGLTQAELAQKIGSAKAYVSQIETGVKPGGRLVMRKIAGALDVPLSVLIED